MMKKLLTLLCTLFMVIIMAGSAFAGTWRTGQAPNQDKWWYDNDNGTYPANGWKWIDGNDDGIAECYCFDPDGWLYTNTTTPDGYTVNENGAWIENGIVNISIVPRQNSGYSQKNESSGYEAADEYDEEILMPWYVEETIFNPDRSVLKYITLGCDTGCRIYYTTGVKPADPTDQDDIYVTKKRSGFQYGSPSLKPGQTLKAIAVDKATGKKSGVTVLRYEDAINANRGRSGNIAGSSNYNNGSGSNNQSSSSSSNSNSAASTTTAPRQCPICMGKVYTTCTYCHGSGIGQNASFGLGGGMSGGDTGIYDDGGIYQGICPSCGGSGTKTCAGCGGIGTVGY